MIRPTPSTVLDDLASTMPGGNLTPTHAGPPRGNTKRTQTLLSILDALSELTQDNVLTNNSPNQQPTFEDDRDVPTVDEHLQVVGAESFNRFQKRINNLDKELKDFANAARQLGSSVAILSSSFHLRERFAQILFLFRENAADLFPRKVVRQPRECPLVNPALKQKRKRPARRKAPPNVARPTIDENLDPENFPEQLESLADDVTTFLYCLNEFPEFTDEAVNASVLSFQGDLKYWASCLKEYKTQFRYPAVQRYIHDLSSEMVEHIDSITSTLSMFIEIGVPTIRFAQKHGATNLLNLSTVATFFSAVTATTLQFSYGLPADDSIAEAVNSFWFASLVFSIAAAVNSLLGLTWKQAMYRSPGHRVPWWVLIWIKRSPLVFLVMSVACFSVGLVCFAYASKQSFITSTLTTVLTAFTSFGLIAVSAWFASERWTFSRHRGKKWLGDVLLEFKDRALDHPGMEPARKTLQWTSTKIRATWISLTRVQSLTVGMLQQQSEETIEDPVLPTATPEPMSPVSKHRTSDAQNPFTTQLSSPTSAISTETLSEKDDTSVPGTPSLRGRNRFTSAVRSVMMLQSASATVTAGTLMNPRRRRTASPSVTVSGLGEKQTTDEPMMALRGSRVATLVPKLKSLETTLDIAAHQALVRHLQFSPDGKFLATSSWDRTSVIFRVGDPFTSHRILAHPQGFVGQVAWSPNGNLLLTKLNRGIKVWTEDGVCRKTIDRRKVVESITWCPGGEAFMSVEGSNVTKLDLNGKILDVFHFDRMKLHDVAVTPDSQRLLGVGPVLASSTGLQPSKSRVEKRLVVYNMETNQFENQTPVLNEVRDITLARNGLVALISYENKAPPQLWKLDLVKDRENNLVVTARLTLRHTYMPKVLVDFAGPSYFGGRDDQLVLCAGKAGDIHIWDRESAVLLHHVRAQALGGDLTCIAWNHASDDAFMFATGSHDGAVRIWTTPKPSIDGPVNGNNSPVESRVISRTATPSPLELDIDYRSDSPVTQLNFERQLGPESPQNENGTFVKERKTLVAFAEPEAVVDYTSMPT